MDMRGAEKGTDDRVFRTFEDTSRYGAVVTFEEEPNWRNGFGFRNALQALRFRSELRVLYSDNRWKIHAYARGADHNWILLPDVY
jgi:hypothetical protein